MSSDQANTSKGESDDDHGFENGVEHTQNFQVEKSDGITYRSMNVPDENYNQA